MVLIEKPVHGKLRAYGHYPLDAGSIAAVVTRLSLDLTTRKLNQPAMPLPWVLSRLPADQTDCYRRLVNEVGAPHLWWELHALGDPYAREALADEKRCVFVLWEGPIARGLTEWLRTDDHRCEVTMFGLVQQAKGSGHGKRMMRSALWAMQDAGLRLVQIETSTLDDPHALGFYQSLGFVPQSRHVEVFADPRQTGLLPKTQAPGIPLL